MYVVYTSIYQERSRKRSPNCWLNNRMRSWSFPLCLHERARIWMMFIWWCTRFDDKFIHTYIYNTYYVYYTYKGINDAILMMIISIDCVCLTACWSKQQQQQVCENNDIELNKAACERDHLCIWNFDHSCAAMKNYRQFENNKKERKRYTIVLQRNEWDFWQFIISKYFERIYFEY